MIELIFYVALNNKTLLGSIAFGLVNRAARSRSETRKRSRSNLRVAVSTRSQVAPGGSCTIVTTTIAATVTEALATAALAVTPASARTTAAAARATGTPAVPPVTLKTATEAPPVTQSHAQATISCVIHYPTVPQHAQASLR